VKILIFQRNHRATIFEMFRSRIILMPVQHTVEENLLNDCTETFQQSRGGQLKFLKFQRRFR